jgi:hypothetical protein
LTILVCANGLFFARAVVIAIVISQRPFWRGATKMVSADDKNEKKANVLI